MYNHMEQQRKYNDNLCWCRRNNLQNTREQFNQKNAIATVTGHITELESCDVLKKGHSEYKKALIAIISAQKEFAQNVSDSYQKEIQELENKLCNLFLEIQKPYAKHCPDGRVNFLNYYYVLYSSYYDSLVYNCSLCH